ncbi:MAG: hypothetical protein IJ898_09715 [Prevotella sp.]|nr:hypothetical protein [Prevotella sp.]
MRQIVGLMMAVLLLAACGGGRRLSPEELQHKLDSVKALEIKERLALQGVNLETSDNPLKLFYDSLEIQSLPISYNEDYVNFLPAFKDVTPEIVSYMELIECKHPKAVALPESVGARLMIMAADETDGHYSLWLYSLDDDYVPVDKLCLYAVDDMDPEDVVDFGEEQFVQYFSITSDYEIRLMDYTKKQYRARLEEVYHVDESRRFALASSRAE